jgi:hypothetical protein
MKEITQETIMMATFPSHQGLIIAREREGRERDPQ